MIICPNCSYKLVLLSNRQKYKCSLCSKLYPKREADSASFRIWNQKQRELDIQNLTTSIKSKPRFRLSEEERRLRDKESAKKWRDANKNHYNDQKRRYYSRNSGHINSKQRENYAKNKEKMTVRKERWQESNPYGYRMKKRLADLRYHQKLLALKHVKNNKDKPSPAQSQEVLPTFLHSDLLIDSKPLKTKYSSFTEAE